VFTDPKYHQYDIILPSLDKINIRTVAEAKRNQAKRIGDLDYATRKKLVRKSNKPTVKSIIRRSQRLI
jgi:hypothetical protein